jgi:hypothetical protein
VNLNLFCAGGHDRSPSILVTLFRVHHKDGHHSPWCNPKTGTSFVHEHLENGAFISKCVYVRLSSAAVYRHRPEFNQLALFIKCITMQCKSYATPTNALFYNFCLQSLYITPTYFALLSLHLQEADTKIPSKHTATKQVTLNKKLCGNNRAECSAVPATSVICRIALNCRIVT